ncbi:MAG: hypothetical protein QOD00_717, partial [Blastocatellia bacterium]|nr:hypothetical protein [Blastocatellia bacterium]
MQKASELKEVVEGYRLSPQQKRLWGLQQDDGQMAYRARCAVLIEGQLDVRTFEDAVHEVVMQHEILRTSFLRQPGMKIPLQVINPQARPSWQYRKLPEASAQRPLDALVEELLREETRAPFDFSLDSLLQLSLLSLSGETHLLLVTLPALCADTVTLRKLVRELSSSYAARAGGGEASEEAAQYLQFSEWQNELLEGEEALAGRAYWLDQEWPSLSLFKIPFERKPSDHAEFNPATLASLIEDERLAQLRLVAGRYGVTVETFLMTCWQTLLWRLTEQSEMLTGKLYDGRRFEELEGVLGLCSRWLPVRCSFKEESRFSDLLKQVHAAAREVEEWQEYFSWDDIAGALDSTDGVESFLPFCFEWREDAEAAQQSAGGLTFSLRSQDACFDRFKLKLACVSEGQALKAEFNYDALLYDALTIERLARCFSTLVESAARNPETVAGELSLLSESDREQIEIEWNRTGVEHAPEARTLHGLFEAQVERTPESVALIFAGEQLTYDELNRRANQLAHHLRRRGIGPDALVNICMERSALMVVALLGTLKAGAAYVPIDPEYPRERVAFLLSDTNAPSLLTQRRLMDELPLGPTSVLCLDDEWESVAVESTSNPNIE